MKITSLHPPINGGTVYLGTAERTDGHRYRWHASLEHGGCGCFREWPDGSWRHEKAPPTLSLAVQIALRSTAH
jgi:hypothetical protein